MLNSCRTSLEEIEDKRADSVDQKMQITKEEEKNIEDLFVIYKETDHVMGLIVNIFTEKQIRKSRKKHCLGGCKRSNR